MTEQKTLATIKLGTQMLVIKATNHSLERMEQRNVDEYLVISNIMGLGAETIERLQTNNEEAIIIDNNTNTSIVIGFSKKAITVITVINKSNVFVKTGTEIVRI